MGEHWGDCIISGSAAEAFEVRTHLEEILCRVVKGFVYGLLLNTGSDQISLEFLCVLGVTMAAAELEEPYPFIPLHRLL